MSVWDGAVSFGISIEKIERKGKDKIMSAVMCLFSV